MLFLEAKFLGARALPAAEPYAASTLVTVLVDTETLNLIGPEDLYSELAELDRFEDLVLELRWRPVDLSQAGGGLKGKAYRLKVVRRLTDAELS